MRTFAQVACEYICVRANVSVGVRACVCAYQCECACDYNSVRLCIFASLCVCVHAHIRQCTPPHASTHKPCTARASTVGDYISSRLSALTNRHWRAGVLVRAVFTLPGCLCLVYLIKSVQAISKAYNTPHSRQNPPTRYTPP